MTQKRKTRVQRRLPPLSEEVTRRHFTCVVLPIQKKEKMWRCVMNVLVTIRACSHQRPERHAHCRVWDDGVPVLHVEPTCTRLRQLRVVLQELEQDDDEVVTPSMSTRAKTKAQIRAKGTTERPIHRTSARFANTHGSVLNRHMETFRTYTRGGGRGEGVGGGFSSLSLVPSLFLSSFFFLSSVVFFIRSLSLLCLLSQQQ